MEPSHSTQPDQSRSRPPRRGFVRVAVVTAAFLVLLAAGGLLAYKQFAAPPTTAEKLGVGLAPAPPAIQVSLDDCLALLKRSAAGRPALIEAVRALIDEARHNGLKLAERSPSLMLVSYREHAGEVDDVVVQIFQTPEAGTISVLNPDGVVRARLGEELFGSAESLMQLLYHPVSYLGDDKNVTRQRRAIQAAIEGDLTLLREQTIEPLHVVAIMPRAEPFLPGSLRTRVQSVVLASELTFGEWRSEVALVTGSEEAAQQVGNTIAAWREIAATLARTYAKHSAGLPLRQSLEDSTVEVKGEWVLTAAKVPSKTVVRVTKEVAGHGGAQGCSQGFYKKPEHWPSGVTQLTLGSQTYTKQEAIDLLNTPPQGDASISLAHQLIAAKLNQIVGLPATPAQLQAIADADALLSSYSGDLPYNVPANSPAGQQMTALASTLEEYNLSCHTGSGGGSGGGGSGGGGSGGGGSGGGGSGGGGSGGGGSAQGCSQGYYKQADHWPSGTSQLTLGCKTYTKAECLTLLSTPTSGDASIALASQLIASKLNQIVSLPATAQQLQAIASADTLLCSYNGKLPYGVPSSSPAGLQMTGLASTLDVYNNSCHTGSTQP